MSRWCSADPVIDLKNTIDFDVYSFCYNNPIVIIDPDGRLEYDIESKQYTITKGDTINSISKETGVGVQELLDANKNIKNKNEIFEGDHITIPKKANIIIFENAAQEIGSTDYDYSKEKDSFDENTNKCNLFVSDMVEKSGRKFPKRETLGFERGPVAAGTLGSNESLENTTIVNNPVIGDIVGWKRDFTDATGHAAIYAGTVIITNKGKKIAGGENSPGTIGAGTHTVNYRTLKYLENQKYLNPVYRRVGDN